MTDLPEAMRLHRLHQAGEQVAALAGGGLQVGQTVAIMHFGGLADGVFHHIKQGSESTFKAGQPQPA